ncbi:MAG TPA: GNAT family N-acetyltransferase [Pyrinomonadaceae bacterium]|nr:GNAT family N-acetyltransferase [Pyrinomonadaceae bacterium]
MPDEQVNIILREATPEDEPFLFELYASTRLEELAGLGWDDNQKQMFIKMQFMARERSFARGDHRIVLLNERPVGRLLVDRNGPAIRLIDIAFLPQYRNAGIGGRLIEDLKQESTASGKPIALHVLASSPAVRLYERLGFRRGGAETAYEEAYLEMKWVPATS